MHYPHEKPRFKADYAISIGIVVIVITLVAVMAGWLR